MRRMAILLAATMALTVDAGSTWQAQAQIERGPAALADTAKRIIPRLKRPRVVPIGAGFAVPGITGFAVAGIAGARPAERRFEPVC
jgi:hypothetical protein